MNSAERIGYRKSAKHLLLFIVGMLILDQAILLIGNNMIFSGYWIDPVLPNIVNAKQRDGFVFGICQAALDIDSSLLTKSTGKRFYNAGRATVTFGHIELAYRLAKNYTNMKYAVFVINDGLWETSEKDSLEDAKRVGIWLPLIRESEAKDFAAKYGLNSLYQKSGFLTYWSFGEDISKTFLKVLQRKSSAEKDGYVPRGPDQNIIGTLDDPPVYQYKEFNPTKYSIEIVNALLEDSVKNHIIPILVAAPMHRYRATDKVNEEQNQLIKSITSKYSVPYISYLDNYSKLASDDRLWSDVGHLNLLGAEVFSKQLAQDLKLLMGKVEGGYLKFNSQF